MALIKNTTAGPLPKGTSVFNLGDLARESKHVLQEAKLQAKQIMRRAEEEAAKLVDSATDRGFAEGKDQGLAQGREEGRQAGRAEAIAEFTPQLTDLQVAFNAALAHWETDRNSMLLAAREDVLRLALAVIAALGVAVLRRRGRARRTEEASWRPQ